MSVTQDLQSIGLKATGPRMKILALFQTARVPGDVKVKQVGTVPLEVDAFPSSISGEQDPNGVFVGRAIEGTLDFFPLLIGHAAMELHDAKVRLISAIDSVT